jgi:hypothetical protein
VHPVRVGIFSFTPPAPPDDDGSYLRWHLLDHMPEQFQLPGVVLAHRWIADDALRAARLAGDGPLADVANVVEYYVGDPVQPTLDDFLPLGGRLREVGRFPERRPSLGVRMLAHLGWYAAPSALVSPGVIAHRPHRGVLLLVEEPAGDVEGWLAWLDAEHLPEVLAVPGVAGAGLYRASDAWALPAVAEGPDVVVTVVYLDEDPLATSRALAPLVEQRWASGAVRPRFAGPLRTMVEWEAWPSAGP